MPVSDRPVIFQVNQITPLITNNSLLKNSDWRKETKRKERKGKEKTRKENRKEAWCMLYRAETTSLLAFEFP